MFTKKLFDRVNYFKDGKTIHIWLNSAICSILHQYLAILVVYSDGILKIGSEQGKNSKPQIQQGFQPLTLASVTVDIRLLVYRISNTVFLSLKYWSSKHKKQPVYINKFEMCSEWENHKNHGLYNPSKSYLMDLNLAKTFFIKQEKKLAFFQK